MEDYYEDYWLRRVEKGHLAEMPRHSLVAATIRKAVRTGGRVLELGVGEGHNLANLAGDYNLSCCDISREALKLVVLPEVRKVQCDLNSSFPFPGEKFDAIICTEVLEHLLRPELLMGRIRGALEPEGVAVISIPNTAHVEYRWTLLRGHFPDFDESHIHFWTIRDFFEFLGRFGFNVRSWQPTYLDFWVFRPLARGPISGFLRRVDLAKELFGREIVFVIARTRTGNPQAET